MPQQTETKADLLLIRRGMEELVAEHSRLTKVKRPERVNRSVVSRGSHVVLEDLDDSTCADFVLVASSESDPEHGRLSDESPVGRAISGHCKGDVVDAHAPHRTRHLRIAEVDRRRP